MTVEEWLTCTDVDALLDFVAGRLSERKLRLYACARCRRVWDLLTDPRSRDAVEAAEWFADRLVSADDLAAAFVAANGVSGERARHAVEAFNAWSLAVQHRWAPRPGEDVAWAEEEFRRLEAEWSTAAAATWAASATGALRWDESARWVFRGFPERSRIASVLADPPRLPFADEPHTLLRDLAGNPFHPPTVRPEWLAWNGGAVGRIARTIYDERRFDDLPVLADALEEAGCASPNFLLHCRRPAQHVPGCWLLDALLAFS
jgi:hypothetical protein